MGVGLAVRDDGVVMNDGDGDRDGGPGEGDGEMRKDDREELGGARAPVDILPLAVT